MKDCGLSCCSQYWACKNSVLPVKNWENADFFHRVGTKDLKKEGGITDVFVQRNHM